VDWAEVHHDVCVLNGEGNVLGRRRIADSFADPEVGMKRVVSMPTVVVLPAPLGPSKPKILLVAAVRLNSSTARKSVPAYTLVRRAVRIMTSAVALTALGEDSIILKF
jgi:hypothetical protein